MRCSRLQGLAVLHHSLDRICVQCTCKTLRLTFDTLHHRYSHVVLGKISIYLQHLLCASLSLFLCCMCSMTLLPQEFRRAQEQSCAHLPAHHVAPLVDQQWQVTVRVNPVLESIPDNCLGCRTYNQLLLQLGSRIYDNTVMGLIRLQTVVRYHSTLLCKAFDMFGLTRKE